MYYFHVIYKYPTLYLKYLDLLQSISIYFEFDFFFVEDLW